MNERSEVYRVGEAAVGRVASPEDDLISLRALSHALRVDTSALRRRIEGGTLRPDQISPNARGGFFFRRDRIASISNALFGRPRPVNSDAWRQEFLDFARSRNLSTSYKPVLLRALLKLVNRNGEAHIDDLAREFRAYYVARRREGLPVELGPPDLTDILSMIDVRLRAVGFAARHLLEVRCVDDQDGEATFQQAAQRLTTATPP